MGELEKGVLSSGPVKFWDRPQSSRMKSTLFLAPFCLPGDRSGYGIKPTQSYSLLERGGKGGVTPEVHLEGRGDMQAHVIWVGGCGVVPSPRDLEP